MNKDAAPERNMPPVPPPITAEEFDAMFDAGEDVSAYIQWDQGGLVAPGELSPGQKLAMQISVETEKSPAQTNSPAQAAVFLSVALPTWAYDQLQLEANREGISQEDLAQRLIVQRLDKEKVLS